MLEPYSTWVCVHLVWMHMCLNDSIRRQSWPRLLMMAASLMLPEVCKPKWKQGNVGWKVIIQLWRLVIKYSIFSWNRVTKWLPIMVCQRLHILNLLFYLSFLDIVEICSIFYKMISNEVVPQLFFFKFTYLEISGG